MTEENDPADGKIKAELDEIMCRIQKIMKKIEKHESRRTTKIDDGSSPCER